jgi:carboxyl-terminal processing protease
MTKKIKKSINSFFIFSLLTLIIAGCSKKDNDGDYALESDPRDSAYLITKDIYLWAEKLPSLANFKARNSSDIYDVMDRVRSYQPLDKWSFVETKQETDQTQKGLDTDFGFLVKFMPGSNTEIRVTYVYANSSAGMAGVKRSWRLNKINGRVINRSLNSDVDYINEIFFGTPSAASFEFIKPDGTTSVVNLNKSTYTLNTVLFSKVYTRGDRKIGYFVFNEFSGDVSVAELVNTINGFQNQGVNEVIVDLRYNRGGFVSTQDTLANMLAPQNVGRGQKIMYTYKFNDAYKSWNETYKFYKTGTLDLSRIVFIVSPSSASASELLINNLRPVMNVKLVGDTRTYGKPVGFFPIPVFQYNIFPVSFKTVNSNGEADFFAGFPVDKNVADDLLHDFGDEEEANLKQALNYLATGNFLAQAASGKIASVSATEARRVSELNEGIADHQPSVAIEDRPWRMPEQIRKLQR